MVLWRVALQVPAKNDGFSSKSNRRLTRRLFLVRKTRKKCHRIRHLLSLVIPVSITMSSNHSTKWQAYLDVMLAFFKFTKIGAVVLHRFAISIIFLMWSFVAHMNYYWYHMNNLAGRYRQLSIPPKMVSRLWPLLHNLKIQLS